MGGAEVALLNIIAAMRQAQPEWKLSLITPDEGPLIGRARSLGAVCEVVHFPNSVARLGDSGLKGPAGKRVSRLSLFARLLLAAPAIIAATVRLRRALRRLNPDIIHTNGFKMHVLGAFAKPRGTPLIWHIHDYVSPRPLMARLIKVLGNRCALIVANSDSVKRDVEKVCGDGVKVQTVYNAVDTKEFSPEGECLDLDSLSGLAVNGSGEAYVRIGLPATFGRWKGQDVFLRALSLLPRDIRWRAYVIGDAIYQTDGSQFSLEELQSLARQLGLSDRVGFTGFVDQPAAAIRALDIVVHASTHPEPFGLTIVEAMSCGRPVIVSNAGGAVELIKMSANGDRQANGNGDSSVLLKLREQIALSHTPGNAEELSARIGELARDSQLRAQLASAGLAAVNHRFAIVNLASELAPLYQSTVGISQN
jgi:glycosyltransferase involved in cell wall biosynthesis